MFCQKNEKFQNLTEKTKLFAQKCTQQIRIVTSPIINLDTTTTSQENKKNLNIYCNNITSPTENLNHIFNLNDNYFENNEHFFQTYKQNISAEDDTNVTNTPISVFATFRRRKKKPLKNNQNLRIIQSASAEDLLNYNCNDYLNITKNSSNRLSKRFSGNFKYICTYTGGTIRNLAKKFSLDDNFDNNNDPINNTNTRWYVKPTWRLWGEEREKDAIFTVYLKKVRYHRPTPTASHDSDDEISHLEWETVRVRFVKAATLSRLVEALATDDGELESTFINVFLSTYRTFSNPKEVLDLLIKRYNTLDELIKNEPQTHTKYQSTENLTYNETTLSIHEQHKKTLVSALHVWLDGFPEDWSEINLKYILAFSSKRLPNSELHLKVLHRLERCLRLQAQNNCHNQQSPLPWRPQNHSYPDFTEQFSGLCLQPAFCGPPSHLLQAYRFPYIPVKHFAEQLTRMDMELFKKLIPHQCLGATWARRDKHEAETVVATVNQFNAVSFRVISSILIESRLKLQERAVYIGTWIDIGQELRLLKNFSSLKAIISGLQSNPIYRLSKTWAALSKEKMEIFTELARIFSEENNAWTQREVLMREGTAKTADTVGENDKHLQKIFQRQNHQTSHGTIPYLGTFLTDLTMIHAAISDTIEESLINFDKKRKEFEILAQIKLLQGAANTYNLREDYHFDRWFASMLVLDERESHTLSCQIEPQTEPRKQNNSTGVNNVYNHRKTDSIASNSSSGAGSQFYCEINGGGNQNGNISLDGSSRNNSLDRDTIPPNSSIMSASSSVSNLSMDSSNSGGNKTNLQKINGKITATGVISENGTPIINAQLVQNSSNKNNSPNFYIIRVTYENNNIESNGVILYKSIMVWNNERTPQVIRNAMLKLDLEGDPEQFTLSQVLPDKELTMPTSANVFYAVNTAYNLNFILRSKKQDDKGQ